MFALFITPAISSLEAVDPPRFNTRCDLTLGDFGGVY
jgi:hypothetical protein